MEIGSGKSPCGSPSVRLVTSKRITRESGDLYLDADEVFYALSSVFENSHSTGADRFKQNYLLSSLLSKLPRSGVPKEDRVTNAISKMMESEDRCRSINLHGYGRHDLLQDVLVRAKATMNDIFGEFCYSIFYNGSFSSGATTSRTLRKGDPYFKYSTKGVDVTPLARPLALALKQATPMWHSNVSDDKIRNTDGNVITTVPKKTETDRVIAKEPDMNQSLQASVGTYLKNRLLKFGIDLTDQSQNQRFALKGSLTNGYATIDLASASDSISRRIVNDLVPPVWLELLTMLRSPYGRFDPHAVRNTRYEDHPPILWQKFSSMGNGFTFELESAIFFAIAKACAEIKGSKGRVIVYGDDIICPTGCATFLIEILECVGFSTNVEKTFIDGPFRESCGKHYYNGIDVSPFYIRKPIDSVSRLCWFLNRLRSWAESDGVCDPRLFELWTTVYKLYSRKFGLNKLLGGVNLDSNTSIVSLHGRRMKLKFSRTSTPTHGWRDYLRVCQDWHHKSLSLNSPSFMDMLLEDALYNVSTSVPYGRRNAWRIGEARASAGVLTEDPSSFSLVENEDVGHAQPCFPQELDHVVTTTE